MAKKTGADILIDTLIDWGVDTAFGDGLTRLGDRPRRSGLLLLRERGLSAREIRREFRSICGMLQDIRSARRFTSGILESIRSTIPDFGSTALNSGGAGAALRGGIRQ